MIVTKILVLVLLIFARPSLAAFECADSYNLSEMALEVANQVPIEKKMQSFFPEHSSTVFSDYSMGSLCLTLKDIQKRYVEMSFIKNTQKRKVVKENCSLIEKELKEINSWLRNESNYSYALAMQRIDYYLKLQEEIEESIQTSRNTFEGSDVGPSALEGLGTGKMFILVPRVSSLLDFFHASVLGFGMSDFLNIGEDYEHADGFKMNERGKVAHDIIHQRISVLGSIELLDKQRIQSIHRDISIMKEHIDQLNEKERFIFQISFFILHHESITCIRGSNKGSLDLFNNSDANQLMPNEIIAYMIRNLEHANKSCIENDLAGKWEVRFNSFEQDEHKNLKKRLEDTSDRWFYIKTKILKKEYKLEKWFPQNYDYNQVTHILLQNLKKIQEKVDPY